MLETALLFERPWDLAVGRQQTGTDNTLDRTHGVAGEDPTFLLFRGLSRRLGASRCQWRGLQGVPWYTDFIAMLGNIFPDSLNLFRCVCDNPSAHKIADLARITIVISNNLFKRSFRRFYIANL